MQGNKPNMMQSVEDIINNLHIPRWEELPRIELYADQAVRYIESSLGVLFEKDEKNITTAMIHNYVKLKLMPKPVKKGYSNIHIAYLIIITILKQVLAIAEIKEGIVYQTGISGKERAYNLFCEEQEYALKAMAYEMSGRVYAKKEIEENAATVRMAVYAFASKTLARKAILHQPKKGKK